MKIAQVAPLFDTVPPRGYGGVERVVADLADALTDRGHDVMLYAASGSRTRARLIEGRSVALRQDSSALRHDIAAHLEMFNVVREHLDSYDIVHFHTDILHLPMFADVSRKVVTTAHTQINQNDARSLYARWTNHNFVALSEAHMHAVPEANWLGYVHNGIPKDRYTATSKAEGYLAFLGRFTPDKGCHIAIDLARRAGRKLLIGARIDPRNMKYFDEEIRPFLDDPLINYVGEVQEVDKNDFLGGADALLFPVTWPEPFGLVMIEAQACGTPVVALAAGAVPEVVAPGVTGEIVNREDDLHMALQKALMLDRRTVREFFEARFSSQRMAERYEFLYAKLDMSPNGSITRACKPVRSTIQA